MDLQRLTIGQMAKLNRISQQTLRLYDREGLLTPMITDPNTGYRYYHIIQSFKPGEATPELALEIAKEFAAEHLSGYQAVIGVHVDKEHIHAHTIFNSVNADTGEKYHSNARSYYSQIRATSDRLCREHGLSVVMESKAEKAVSYIEWLRQSKGQPTFRSMLEADLREAIEDANDIGHFFLIMEHKGYEIKHGNRLGFRLRGQDRFMVPGRKNPLFTEDGIRAAIGGNLDAIAAALDAPTASGKPKCILAHTVKGKGVSFMEDQVGWHGKAPNEEQRQQALKELED